MSESVYVVQFPHPGPEHDPGSRGRMGWNTGPKHKRKFMRSAGRYVDRHDDEQDADLVFWGEWEPPSTVVETWIREPPLPSFLHEPTWGGPEPAGFRQNTDPWVFGDSFRFSNCKQLTWKGNPSALQRLTAGSVVLFGSRVDGQFALDTVFVVATGERFLPGTSADLDVDDAFRVCTVESLLTSGGTDAPLTLFRGATRDHPVAGMYSFVPCRLSDSEQPRFARPAIELPGYVNPTSWQSPSGALEARSIEKAQEKWQSVRRQVLAAGCALGTWFPTPERSD